MSGPTPDKEPVHTVLSVMRGAEAWLQRRGADAPQRSAELLLGKVLGLSRLQLYLAHDRPLDQRERDRMRELVARRGAGEPVAYLIGSWAFRGIELEVGPAVLIPRPETEGLVDAVLARAPEGARVADLGTGSGAIAVALAVERPDLRVLATDVSKNALLVARANVTRHAVQDRVELVPGSWWEAVPGDARFHLVVSNPPYIDPESTGGLAPDVRAFEPPLALFSAPQDVLSCYRAIVAGLDRHLLPGGWFVAETGVGASDPGLELLRAQSFLTDAQLLKDHAGIDRVLVARRTSD
ncbi:MAG TPA: peptide chain release factor N(5)-glutamine methyltransferase [Planctomycetota bacterium]|nr:peptide chain release factor N(5)-glutamine methyltransferase [Planctomycetota bacterium]